jgi:DNA-binding NarL/FixJ family response regulator
MNTTALIQNTKPVSPLLGRNPKGGPANGIGTVIAHPEISRIAKMKKQIKVLLVDDHPIVRKGIASCLAKSPDLQIIGEAVDGVEALKKTRDLGPDVILMDIDMPNMSGLAVTQALRKELPHVKVLILSMHRQTDYVLRILQSGALGYVLKDAPVDELVEAIQTVYSGQAYFSSDIARVALTQFVRGSSEGPSPMNLTNREREVLIFIAEGLSNKEIAVKLNLGVRTVETHRERIMRKLNIHSIAGLTRFAIAKGLISIQGMEN